MNSAGKNIGKYIGSASIILDIIGIILGQLDLKRGDTVIHKIANFCSCWIFELYFVLLLIAVVFLCCCFRKYLKERELLNNFMRLPRALLTLSLLISIVCSYKELRLLIDARYYYHNNQLDEIESQLIPVRKVDNLYRHQDWEKCYDQITTTLSLYPNGYFQYGLEKAEKNIELLMDYEDFLFDTYLLNNDKSITIEAFRCAQLLAQFNPNKYAMVFKEQFYEPVFNAIQKYSELYSAVEYDDSGACAELIKDYGWCWFEPSIQDMLVKNEPDALSLIKKYMGEETNNAACRRLRRVWGIDDKVLFRANDNLYE